ncbi:hypothetical protein [Streptomyces sp. NPDC056491]|uniref:hypothetical protein n=1 Tax=Streptomyces sp. NPDC056491 TaxID=3345837 RepID=UPI0036A307CC
MKRMLLATHWNAFGDPDGSLPLRAVVLLPVSAWTALVAGAVFWRAARRWRAAVLLSCAVLLAGEQATIVRANLSHADGRDADCVTAGAVVTVVTAFAAGPMGMLVHDGADVAADPAVRVRLVGGADLLLRTRTGFRARSERGVRAPRVAGAALGRGGARTGPT